MLFHLIGNPKVMFQENKGKEFNENKGKEFLLIGNPKVQTRTKVKSSGKKMSVDSFPQTLIVRQSSELQS